MYQPGFLDYMRNGEYWYIYVSTAVLRINSLGLFGVFLGLFYHLFINSLRISNDKASNNMMIS